MYHRIRMHTLYTNIMLDSVSPDQTRLISALVTSNVFLLKHLGIATGQEDYTDLAHIQAEIAFLSSHIDEEGKEAIRDIMENK